jgi:hypothetical protein
MLAFLSILVFVSFFTLFAAQCTLADPIEMDQRPQPVLSVEAVV